MKRLAKLVKILLGLGFAGILIGAGATYGLYLYLQPTLPSVELLKDARMQVPLRVFSRDGRLIAEFGEKRRIPLAFEEVPERMVQAFLAAEDDRFFEHPGVDYQGLLRAASQLLLTGERRQGGSTITMQVARNFFLSSERTFSRKLTEIFLALRIEQELSKQEILALYLNKIYLGNRAYGVGAAAQIYYGTTPANLNLAQIAMIAGLPKAPSRYNPIADPERSRLRRDYVLRRMEELRFITPEEHELARAAPVSATLHTARSEVEAPYLAEMVRKELVDRFGPDAYTAGYVVHTTLDSRLQAAANAALRGALETYDLRHGYRGPEARIEAEPLTDEAVIDALEAHPPVAGLFAGVVTALAEKSATVTLRDGLAIELPWEGLSWARPHVDEDRVGDPPNSAAAILKPGDLVRVRQIPPTEGAQEEPYWTLSQLPEVEGALVALDPNDGAVQALIGGYDFQHSKFNRVVQASRQPGSGFKPFIYSAALDAGFTPASLINDAPVVFDDPGLEAAWRPENYSGKFFGPTRLRYALTQSRNLVSIRLLRQIGVDTARDYARRFGFDSARLPSNLSLALGSGAVTPLQMAQGYAVLANGGYRVEPYFIDRIEEDHREPLLVADPLRVCEGTPPTVPAPLAEITGPTGPAAPTPVGPPAPRCAERTLDPRIHYLITSMLRDVVTQGTARKARALGRKDIAGKTGTTNDQRDAWFNGFNRDLVAIAWVGFDDFRPLGRGEVGGRAALPAWLAFMERALEGRPEHWFKMPPGLVTVRIDATSGELARAGQPNTLFELFLSENAPIGRSETIAPTAVQAGRPRGGEPAVDPF